MKISARVVPVEVLKTYNGTTDKGSYVVDTWKMKSVLDQKDFVATAFTKETEILKKNVGLELDIELELTCKEFKGNWYNDFKVFKIDYEEPAGETPISTPITSQLPPSENDLPF